jgi:SAM-dependent methyltransferase
MTGSEPVQGPSILLAKNRARPLLDDLETALASGEISENEWFERIAAVITPAYLAGQNARAQSGHSGDEEQWRCARSLIVDCIPKSGSFLDIGCANGHLMESLCEWGREKGLVVDVFGLDISPELVDLAERRLPQFVDRFFVGNALTWKPPRKFDFVRTCLEYVPRSRQRDLLTHLLAHAVRPGGRLIIGTFNEEREEFKAEPALREIVEQLGFEVAGEVARPHQRDPRLFYKAFWIDG